VTENITVRVTTTAGSTVVSVSGEIDLASAPVVRDAIKSMIENGTHRFIVDLGGVDFMDSTGLSLLIAVHTQLGPGALGVVANRANVRRVLAVTGIDTVIPVFDSLDAAVEALSKTASD
jgi:anti-sigma B factor antagonist